MITQRESGPPVETGVRPVLQLMAGRMVGFAASFFIPVALARIFDQADFGTYKQLFLIAATLYGIGQFGMAESLYYFLPHEPQSGARLVTNACLALVVGGLACLASLWLGGEAVSRWMGNPELARHTTLLGLYVSFVLTSAGLEIVMIARKRYGWASWSYALLDLLRAGLLVIPAVLVPELDWLLVGAVGFAAVRCAATIAYLWWTFDGALRPDAELMRRQLGYTIPFYLSGILELVQSNVHQYAVAYRFDAATFAIYSVGCLQIPLVELVFASMATVMMVRMTEELRNGRESAALLIWHDSCRKLALLFCPLTGLLVVTAHPIVVVLFTQTYAASAPIFMVSSLGLLLPALAVDGVLRVYAETRFLFALNVARLLVTVALIGALITKFGLVGAVVSTLIAAGVAKAIGLARIAVLMKVKASQLLPWRDFGAILGAALAAAALAVAVKTVFELTPLSSLLLTSAAYGTAYLFAVWALDALRPEERLALRRRLERWRIDVSRQELGGDVKPPCVESPSLEQPPAQR
jgi:O-antigen/teichoic acid export membrane protein